MNMALSANFEVKSTNGIAKSKLTETLTKPQSVRSYVETRPPRRPPWRRRGTLALTTATPSQNRRNSPPPEEWPVKPVPAPRMVAAGCLGRPDCCRCQNRQISGRGTQTVRLRIDGNKGQVGHNVYPGSGP